MDSWTRLARQPVLLSEILSQKANKQNQKTDGSQLKHHLRFSFDCHLYEQTHQHIYTCTGLKKAMKTIFKKLFVAFEEIHHTVPVMFLKQLSWKWAV